MDSSDSDSLLINDASRRRIKRLASRKKFEEKRKIIRQRERQTSKLVISSSENESVVVDNNVCHSSVNESENHWALRMPQRNSPPSLENSSSSDESYLDSSCSSVYEKKMSLWEDLRKTALETNMTEQQINRVLADLKRHDIGPLPMDARTLKKNLRFPNEIKEISGMEYYYFGIEEQIRTVLARYDLQSILSVEELLIKDNVDGLPLFKSSNIAVWPLLAKIDNLVPSCVFPIFITVGSSKPNSLEFLHEAIDEMEKLTREGICFNEHRLRINFVAHICDTPARNFIKGTVSFHSYNGCDFCECRGFYNGKRMTWRETDNLIERTDESFRLRYQPNHHRVNSPFENIQCDMVMTFPIDFMHQGCGVMLKILKWNVMPFQQEPGRRRESRMSASNIKILNSRLVALRRCVPNCFARRPRSTKDLLRFKATELRQILLYTGRVVFKDIMASDELFVNLCTLNAACCLLVDPTTASAKNDLASELLVSFCEQSMRLYGTSFMVYNVHILLHLPRIAMTHGSLDSVSAYSFENYLGELKRSVRSPLHPIVSLIKHVYERQEACKNQMLQEEGNQKIYTKYPNNCYVDNNKKKCFEAISLDGSTVCVKEYIGRPFFREPISSDTIGCYLIKNDAYTYKTIERQTLADKRRAMKIDLSYMAGMKEKNSSVFMSMYHVTHCRFP